MNWKKAFRVINFIFLLYFIVMTVCFIVLLFSVGTLLQLLVNVGCIIAALFLTYKTYRDFRKELNNDTKKEN